MRYFRMGLLALITLLICAIGVKGNEGAERALCGVSLILQEDSFSQDMAEAFSVRLGELGYRTRVAYCGNDVATQLEQIGSFITQGAKLVAVERAGVYNCYEELFRLARENGCKVIVLDSGGRAEHCDIWVKEYSVYQGMRVCEMVKSYLDRAYPDAEAGGVELLLLEMVNNLESVEICAGYELIGERFLRQYDLAERAYVHQPGGTVLYYDANGVERSVEEETGGLLLDQTGHARLNPYYDARINLRIITMESGTNLDAQSAIDRFMNTSDGPDLRIVLATTGDAVIGAGERLMRYQASGAVGVPMEKLAVFGKGDISTITLVQKSFLGESLVRGYTTAGSATSRVNRLVDMIVQDEEGVCTISDSTRIRIDERYHIFGVVTVAGNAEIDPESFFVGGTQDVPQQ